MDKIYNKFDILEDSEIDIKLKNYFDKMINFVGEDYTCESLNVSESIQQSIATFSDNFDDVNDNDIIFSLLKSAILSNNNSYSVYCVKQLVSENKIDELLTLANEDFHFRRELVRNSMNQCLSSNLSLFNRLLNSDEAYVRLYNLLEYQNSLKDKEKEYKLKREN